MILVEGQISVVVLGIAQDAGVPHVGCRCSRCQAAYADRNLAQFAAAIAIVDGRQNPPGIWLIDATPDVKHQLNQLAEVLGPNPTRSDRLRQPDGLFLTHGHMGHTAGLVHFGPEAMAVHGLRVYASSGLITALLDSQLWSPLVSNLALTHLEPNVPLVIADGLEITPVPVPHRDEIGTKTFAYQITGEKNKLIYVPDIDSWALWPGAKETLGAVDVALVDASFFSSDEIQGRESVSHPLVPETLAFFREIPTRLVLTHLNHTNPLLDVCSEERRLVESNGVEVAEQGQTFVV